MTELRLGPAVRTLTAEDLGVGFTATAASGKPASAPDTPEIDYNDPDALEVIGLLEQYSGVLLTGAPGTSKTYLAHMVAEIMTEGDKARRAFAQFHPSYQYEDFMEGYRPREPSVVEAQLEALLRDSEKDGEAAGPRSPAVHLTDGFERRPGVFLDFCERAAIDRRHSYVMVIDEPSRGDAARVFGESLTYIEKSKRGMTFTLPSGRETTIPPNVHIIATMNPLDRGVDEVDAAFERRFAKKTMLPDVALLNARLIENEMPDDLRNVLIDWFRDINGQGPAAQIGHAYFWTATDEKSLKDLWEYQVQHHVARAFRYDEPTAQRLNIKWEGIFVSPDEA